MPSTGDVAAKIVAALTLSEPDLDTAIGTPVRKIIDAVAESVAEAYTDSHLINYQYDIDSKIGGDLDDFCSLFGITRIPAQRAQGVVTFSRPNDSYAAITALVIPPGTQVVAQTNPVVYVATTVSALLNPGQLSVDVPVQAVLAGTAGNVPAGLLNTIASATAGVTTCLNAAPLTGGSSQEADPDLRTRFRATVFRSLAGTQSMYQAVAVSVPQDPSTPAQAAVSATNVLGSTKRYREQIQVTSGAVSSSIVGAAYIFGDSVFCGADIDAGNLLVAGTNWTFAPTNPTNNSNASATLTPLTGMPAGIYDLSFEYVPQASRNDPANTRFGGGGVNNRIDVWCNGSIPVVATQSITFSNAITFTTSPGVLYNGAFEQSNQAVLTPPSGTIFLPLSFGPIISIPATLTIAGTTYTQGVDYWFVQRKDAFGYASRSYYGLAWQTARKPANGSVFALSYTYNAVPGRVQDAVDQWRLVGTDAWAHAGKGVPIKVHLAIVYDRAYDPTAVNTAVDVALGALVNRLGFLSALQVSDILQTAHNVPGVDDVRFLTSTDDASHYAMERMSVYAPGTPVSVYASGGRATNVALGDDSYAIYYGSRIVAKAQNTFPVGA